MLNLNQYQTMGVINVTPNSFSDPVSSLDSTRYIKQLNEFLSIPNLIIDLGFESTAPTVPMNQAITKTEERKRFLEFLAQIRGFNFAGHVISFDTYRVDNFLFMKDRFSEIHSDCEFIFNDVSGVLDNDLAKALEQESFHYIFNSTHIPSRNVVNHHMTFTQEGDPIEKTLNSFMRAEEYFIKLGCLHRLILDPGFGFSKSYEQNWTLINRFSDLLKSLPENLKKTPILIGLSKKSFLRKALMTESFEESELLHFKCLVDFMKLERNPLLFRVHDPKIVTLAKNFSL